MTQRIVSLAILAKVESAREVRVIAAELAFEAHMTVAEIEDVRIAVDEAFMFAAMGYPIGAEVNIRFILDGRRLVTEIELYPASVVKGLPWPIHEYSSFILSGVMDECEFVTDTGRPFLRIGKRAEEAHVGS